MDPGVKLSKSMSPLTLEGRAEADGYPYREVVGSLMYLMITSRPDISFAVGQLAMYMNCHGPQHHAAAQHVLRYLQGTRDVGLTYGLDRSALSVSGYSDADWGAHVDTAPPFYYWLCLLPCWWPHFLEVQTPAYGSSVLY